MEPELIADYECEVGEGPLWHPQEKRLYWADIPAGRLFRYDPAPGSHEVFFDGDVVGGFTFQADGSLLLFMAKGRVAVLRDGALTNVIDQLPGEELLRFNDVIADPEGRVFCGTIPSDDGQEGKLLGRLYRLDTDGSITKVVDDIAISNGMGFTSDRRRMYFTDSLKGIDVFDYDQATGDITNRTPLVRLPADGSSPDGMTMDAEGNIWSARWGASGVFGYRPRRDGVQEGRVSHRCGVQRDLRRRGVRRHVRHHRRRPRQDRERPPCRCAVQGEHWGQGAAGVPVPRRHVGQHDVVCRSR